MLNRNINICLTVTILSYILIETGLHGDDYIVIHNLQHTDLSYFLSISEKIMIFNPITYYTFWWSYFLLGYEHQWVYDTIKIITHALSLYFIFRFSQDYLPEDRSYIAAIIFLLYPLHDSTTYWYMTTPYILTPSIILFSHHLIRHKKYISGSIILLASTFSYYTSPPYVFGLSVIFILEKKYKEALICIAPVLLYTIYYFSIKYSTNGVERRINDDLKAVDFIKQMIMQIISSTEAAIGPSYWIKVFYATSSIGLVSIIMVTFLTIFFYKNIPLLSRKPRLNKPLFIGLTFVLLFSFGMFSLTGLYSHSPFNLGNRTTVYGSLLIAFLLASVLPANKKSILLLLIIFLLPVFGLSDYWKSWNTHQKELINSIQSNQALSRLTSDSTLLVTGNIYSKLGAFSHIEFFSMPWTVNTIFNGMSNVKSKNIIALTSHISFEGHSIIDQKFGHNYLLTNKIYVYDSNLNSVNKISLSDIPNLLKNQPKEIRHWLQLHKNTWVNDSIVWLSPRLSYLFQ